MTGDGAPGPGADYVVITAVKDAGQAKSRLGPDLDAGTRRSLVIAMVDDLLSTVREVWAGRIVVVSPDPVYDAIALDHGATVVRDRGEGYNEAIALALSTVLDAEAALVLPGDLPHADVDHVTTLLNALAEPGVCVVTAEDGGTLALGLTPPSVIAPAFGPDSARAHEEAAKAAGQRVSVGQLAGLTHDVDTLEDLARVWDRVGEATTALLEHLPIPTRSVTHD
ncbi:MAG: 2-phospho-L-lactate guanylyltransferase [Dehalococcoidia bacterium]|nr:2-phospho-L-lactate guanylyltransferase [Dehalococcoidia bacterium]MCB9491938.1 2-phospho-L-lactate guanylyltransferase [Dehalococcoidia bacterium]